MSGKEGIANVDSFIKDNILRSTTLDIEAMESILREVNEIAERLEEYEKRQVQLEEINAKTAEINEINNQIEKNNVLYVVANYEHLNEELLRINKNLYDLHREDDVCTEEMESLSKKRDGYKEQQFRLENMDDKQQLAEFNREKASLETRLSACKTAKKNLMLKVRHFGELLDSNTTLKSLFKTDFDWNDVEVDSDKSTRLLSELDAFQDVLMNGISKDTISKNDLNGTYNSLKSETEQLKSGLSASHVATNALKAINKYFSDNWIQDEAKVVCDCIDFKTNDVEWKATLESYLGAVRFYVVVKPENYQAAKEIVKKGNFYNVSVIDTTEDFDKSSRSGSICDLLSYNNDYVEQFLKYKYGGIMAVESCLNGVPDTRYHYLGKDGTTYGGRVFSLKNTKVQYYIGQDAKAALIANNEKLLESYACDMKALTQKLAVCNQAKDEVRRLIYDMNNIDKSIFRDLLTLPGEIEVIDENIRDLTSDHSMFDTQSKIRDIQDRIKECDDKQKELQKRQVGILKRLGVAEEKKEEDATKLEEIKPQYLNYQENTPDSFAVAKKEYAEILADSRKTVQSVSKSLELDKQKLENSVAELNRQLIVLQRTYCDLYNSSISFAGIDSAHEFEIEYTEIAVKGLPELRNEFLIKKAAEIDTIKINIMKFFKRGFDETEQIIKNLNKSLIDITHGGKTYLLTTPVPAQGFETFYTLIKDTEISGYESSNSVEHTDAEYEEFYNFVRSNPDYQDYRNYIKCDVAVKKYEDGQLIEKRLSDSLSVSSGGEKQVPLYILSAMSMLSIYVADRTNDVLRFVILDEAFSFIDASHTESVLGYFDAIDLQLIVGVPDRMAQLFAEFTDNQILVTNKSEGRTFKASRSPRKFIAFNRVG
jgi:DNA repair exonuclease SbcCD ATPase subunit